MTEFVEELIHCIHTVARNRVHWQNSVSFLSRGEDDREGKGS